MEELFVPCAWNCLSHERKQNPVNNEDGSKDDTIDVESIINFIPFEFTDDDDFIIIVAKEFAKSVTDEILHGAKKVYEDYKSTTGNGNSEQHNLMKNY
jgi:hypothetical protein